MSEHSHTRPAGRGYCGNTLQCMPSIILAARMGADRCGEGEGASGAPDLQGDQRTGEKVGEMAPFKGKRSGIRENMNRSAEAASTPSPRR